MREGSYDILHQMIGFSNQLHVTIFDSIVHHFDKMTSTFFTNPVTARILLALSTNCLKNIFDVGPSCDMSTGHKRGSIPGPLLPTRDPRSNIKYSLFFHFSAPSGSVLMFRIASIYNNVTFTQQGN